MKEKPDEYNLDAAWISVPGIWNDRYRSADPADRAALYGNRILLCKELGKVTYLVSVNRSLQKTSGQLCAGKSHDAWNKTENYRNGDRCDGDRFSLHEKYADRKNLYHSGVGMPYFIFFPACKNSGLKTEIFIDKKAKKYYY